MEQTQPSPRAVRIYRRNRQWVVDCGGRPEPNVTQLYSYMTPSMRQSCREAGHYEIGQALAGGISPQALATAISAWFVEHPNTRDNVVMEEGVAELGSNSVYLSLGDYIYKMVPVRQASASKAIRLMRERVRVEIERVCEGLRQQASQEAQYVIRSANERAATIRAEAERVARAQDSMIKFPQGLAGVPLKAGSGLNDSGNLFAMVKTYIVFTELAHGDKRWPMNPGRKPIKVNFWLPLSGMPEYVRLEEGSKDLPHVSVHSCCLNIGEKVIPIDNEEKLKLFSGQVTRAFSVINLASLLRADIGTWNPEIVALLPPAMKAWLETYRDMNTQRDNPAAIAGLPPTDILERQEETWSVR